MIAGALNVNYRALYEPTLYAAEDLMYTLFELDEHYMLQLHEIIDNSDPDFPKSQISVSFNSKLLDGFMKEWKLRKQELKNGEITKQEYMEWKINWPQTADDCGKFTPSVKWRKEKKTEEKK